MERSAAVALNKPLSFGNDEVALSLRFAVHIDRHKQNAEIVTEEITKSSARPFSAFDSAGGVYRTPGTLSAPRLKLVRRFNPIFFWRAYF